MTITFKSIKMDCFLDLQKVITGDYLEFGPTYDGSPRKAWESKYDPKFNKGSAPKINSTIPDASSLPVKKWVKRRLPENREEAFQFAQDCDAWLVERKVKYQTCLVMVEGAPTWVHLFKKANDALLFKLTWG